MRCLSRRCRSEAGITLVETMVAAGVTVAALASLSASVQQASRLARSGKAFSSASELLEERIEAFRYAPAWSSVTTASGIASITAAAGAIAGNFPGVTEKFTVQPYPTGTLLIVTRSPDGTFSNNGAVLPTTKCVKVTVTATWTAVGSTQQSRQVSTILAKGGI